MYIMEEIVKNKNEEILESLMKDDIENYPNIIDCTEILKSDGPMIVA